MEVQKQAGVLTAGKPTAEQLEKINLQAKTPLTAEEVYVFSVRLCDDQPDRDHERFSTEALPKLAELFVGKTGVADHAWSSEKQLARIFETGVEYGDGAAFIRAWAYILRTDKTAELIREIEAGIKKEVSVGCAMGRSVCSICGADYGTCQHEKGQVYGGKECIAVLCEPQDAYEFSFVAVPAQRNAGVLKRLRGEGDELTEFAHVHLQKQAELGRQYRERLRGEVVRLAMLTEVAVEQDILEGMVSALTPEQLLSAEKSLKHKAEGMYPPVCQLAERPAAAKKTDSAFLM